MPFELRPMEDADFPAFTDVLIAAFDRGVTAFLTPQPVTAEYKSETAAKHLKSHLEEADCQYFKVVDTAHNDRLISAAKWRINEKERTVEQIQGMLPVVGEDEEGRPAAQDFMNYLRRVRVAFMGTKPFAFLHLLVTDPEYQRQGAGGMLLAWGTQVADRLQLPCFLEASEEGRPLYARHGFAPVSEQTFDLEKYGGQGIVVNTAMIRQLC